MYNTTLHLAGDPMYMDEKCAEDSLSEGQTRRQYARRVFDIQTHSQDGGTLL